MRILYAAGERIGANTQLCRFIQAVGNKHEIKKAAYLQSSYSLAHIDWTLDALHHNVVADKHSQRLQGLFGHKGIPLVNIYSATTFLKEVDSFSPDLIISDGEPISAHIAKSLKIKLWYCSPIHLLDGVQWESGQLRYKSLLDRMRGFLSKLPEPDRIFVYSPFGDIKFRPLLNTGYTWITPYYVDTKHGDNNCTAVVNDYNRFSHLSKMLNGCQNITLFSPFKEEFSNMETHLTSDTDAYLKVLSESSSVFTTGETSYVSDAFYAGHNICISPTLNDIESLLNAILIKEYKIGTDIHQVELMDRFALDEIEKGISKAARTDYISSQERLLLNEELCNV